jgi:protein phosphatase
MATPPLPPPSSPRPANDPEKAPAATAAAPPENDVTAELDADEVARGWRAIDDAREGRQRRQPRKHALVCWGARSDIGRVRENNEDKFDFFLPDDPHTLAARGRLWAVADGMGGHNAGQIASEAALKAVVRAYYGGDAEEGVARGDDGAAAAAAEEPGERLRAALEGANALIHQAASRVGDNRGMGTTATVAVVRDDQLTVGHVGDSRAYLLRAGVLRQLTDDHSWVEEQVRRGGMSREQAEASPYRNVITRLDRHGRLDRDRHRPGAAPGR